MYCIFVVSTMKDMKTELFKIAHSIKEKFNSFGEALKSAWRVIKMKIKMKKGNVSFKFVKKDGSIREAVGTLNVDYTHKGSKSKNYSVFNYFDLESNGWRSFQVHGLIY